ncbi:putative quinol monooxygenase [Reichenbachiella versicolor]|uniref:putative quinol monooxygenase n=1 Tax=Reichenbachiella versicolor TaxID=1821036 RepID=UPI000D6E8A40|nr:antibiotic biosynthesis monooxygenase [Reichenbachiella versicolor]
MLTVRFNYKVRQVALINEVHVLINRLVEQVSANEPDTLNYIAYQHDEDIRRFIHVMTFRDMDAREEHRHSDHYEEFIVNLTPLCESEPHVVILNQVASKEEFAA